MDTPRHGPPEMSFLRKRNEKVSEQKVPCLDAKILGSFCNEKIGVDTAEPASQPAENEPYEP